MFIIFRHLSCEEGRIEESKLLINKGADITLQNKDKLTPFELAPVEVKIILEKM